jgi:hypothetical protein
VRAGLRAGRGYVDRQGSVRAGNRACVLAGRCAGRQGSVRAGNGMYEWGNGGAGRGVCVRADRKVFYLSELNMYIQKERVTFFCFSVQARTYYGARHGLETLSQMIAFDDSAESLTIYSTAQVRPYVLG